MDRPLWEKLCWSWDMLKVGAGNCLVSLAIDVLPSFLPLGTSQVGPPDWNRSIRRRQEMELISALRWSIVLKRILWAHPKCTRVPDRYYVVLGCRMSQLYPTFIGVHNIIQNNLPAQLHLLHLKPRYQHMRLHQGTLILVLAWHCQWHKMHAKKRWAARLFLHCSAPLNLSTQKHHSPWETTGRKFSQYKRRSKYEKFEHWYRSSSSTYPYETIMEMHPE